jgi:hypothetical protein
MGGGFWELLEKVGFGDFEEKGRFGDWAVRGATDSGVI